MNMEPKKHHPTSERYLRHVFTQWLESPTDYHTHQRVQSVMRGWELDAQIKRAKAAEEAEEATA